MTEDMNHNRPASLHAFEQQMNAALYMPPTEDFLNQPLATFLQPEWLRQRNAPPIKPEQLQQEIHRILGNYHLQTVRDLLCYHPALTDRHRKLANPDKWLHSYAGLSLDSQQAINEALADRGLHLVMDEQALQQAISCPYPPTRIHIEPCEAFDVVDRPNGIEQHFVPGIRVLFQQAKDALAFRKACQTTLPEQRDAIQAIGKVMCEDAEQRYAVYLPQSAAEAAYEASDTISAAFKEARQNHKAR